MNSQKFTVAIRDMLLNRETLSLKTARKGKDASKTQVKTTPN